MGVEKDKMIIKHMGVFNLHKIFHMRNELEANIMGNGIYHIRFLD